MTMLRPLALLRHVILFLGLLPLLFACRLAFGQTLASTASVSGTVADPQGARIMGATATLTSSEKAIIRIFKTDSSGTFSFSLLPPAVYILQVQAPGFKTYEQTGIVLRVGQAATLNVALALGAVRQRVVVSGETPLLATRNANMGSEVTGKQIVALPLNFRSVVSLAFLDSSVNNLNQGTDGASVDTADQDVSFLNFGGQYMGSTAYLLDGAWDGAGLGWDGIIFVPSVDDVQEFKIQTNSFTAQYGLSTGNTMSVITKSGTDKFHGDAYEFFRNDALDANYYLNNFHGVPKTSLRMNQFGVSEGGPLYIPGIYKQRDRTFFFVLYEGLRLESPSSLTATVPDAAFRAGDLSTLLGGQIGTDALGRPILAGQIYNPQSRQIGVGSNGNPIYIRDPIPGNIIPPNMMDSVAKNLLNYFPEPTAAGLSNNFFADQSAPTGSDQFSIRIDHNVSDSGRLYGKFARKWESKQVSAPLYGSSNPAGPGQLNPDNRYSVGLGYTQILSPTFVASFNSGFQRWVEGNIGQAYPYQPSSLGLPAVLDSITPSFPRVGVSGFATLGGSSIANYYSEAGSLSADFSKVYNAHTLSFGYMGTLFESLGGAQVQTGFSFNQAFTSGPDPTDPIAGTGNPFASFLLGAAESGSTGINIFPVQTMIDHGFYVQDDWKTTSKLTLNFGLRYDIQQPPTERHNRQAAFDPTAVNPIGTLVGGTYHGALVYSSNGHRGLYNAAYDNLAPRFGLAYAVDKKLVVRSGFGIFFPQNFMGAPANPGYSQTTSYVASLNGGISPASTLSNPFPNGILPSIGNSEGALTDVGQNVKTVTIQRGSSYVEQWMFGFEYSPTSHNLLDVSYIGNHGIRMMNGGGVNLNQLPPEYLAQGSALIRPVANPFYGQAAVAGSSCGLNHPTVPAFQLLLPMPQYCDSVVYQKALVGGSSYNALQARFTHRANNGLTLMASYTFSKFLDNTTGENTFATFYSQTIRNYYDLAAERAVDVSDIPNAAVISYIYPLPVGVGRRFGSNFNALTNVLLGGWQVSGISTFKQGYPIAIGGNLDPASLFGGNQHVNVIGEPNRISGKGVTEWFNTSAFAPAAPGAFGNAPAFFSNLRTPGFINTDLAIEKWFNFTESLRGQLRGEMFNAFNRPNLGPPHTSFGASTFGTIGVAGPARLVQLAFKLYW